MEEALPFPWSVETIQVRCHSLGIGEMAFSQIIGHKPSHYILEANNVDT